jgi:hypothetical protein
VIPERIIFVSRGITVLVLAVNVAEDHKRPLDMTSTGLQITPPTPKKRKSQVYASVPQSLFGAVHSLTDFVTDARRCSQRCECIPMFAETKEVMFMSAGPNLPRTIKFYVVTALLTYKLFLGSFMCCLITYFKARCKKKKKKKIE